MNSDTNTADRIARRLGWHPWTYANGTRVYGVPGVGIVTHRYLDNLIRQARAA